jgi:hypothetical protein
VTGLGVIIFDSIRFLSKKVIKLVFLKKPKLVQTETGSANRFQFGSVFSSLAWFFLGFFGLGSVF